MHTDTDTLTFSHTLTQSYIHTHTQSHTPTHTYTHIVTHTHTHILTHTHTHAPSHTHSLTLIHRLTYTHTHTHMHSHRHTHHVPTLFTARHCTKCLICTCSFSPCQNDASIREVMLQKRKPRHKMMTDLAQGHRAPARQNERVNQSWP